ncbi:MAG: ATPase central domain protein [Mucilaginibacter sp.]|nr:ATPase central domain protein [Mucilaginibacter sp.]
MSQAEYIKDIAKFGLENDQEKLMSALNDLIEHSKHTKKINFALQLQSIVKESVKGQKTNTLVHHASDAYYHRQDDRDYNELILEKLSSDYTLENLIATPDILHELKMFIKEHASLALLQKYDLPVSNKILLYGPSGCGKTLASYVIAGELKKTMVVVNLGAIVSSKLGETSKNLSRIFRRAAIEDCIIFIDEFDSLGKVRDYSQDHGEMKRVVNTILQLFDYLPQTCLVIAATNQKDMLDEALMRRFDFHLELELPSEKQVRELIKLVLSKGNFQLDMPRSLSSLIKLTKGLSYYSIQKTLITAIKRSLLDLQDEIKPLSAIVHIETWRELIIQEKKALK